VRAYTQLLRIASLLGYRKPAHVSAREFANEIGTMTVRYGDARHIIDAFERCVYGPTEHDVNEPDVDSESEDGEGAVTDITGAGGSTRTEPDLGRAWRNLARAMLKHRIMTIFGITPTYIPDDAQEQYRFTT
jgi:hypothetical protein